MESRPKPGRPRSTASRGAILEAAFALLVTRGYAGLTMEGVAEAAGAGKTTVYRWWQTRADLAVDAFLHATTEELRLPDTGQVAEDFRLQITELVHLLRGPRGAALAAMLGGGQTDPVLAAALGSRWLAPRRSWGFARMSQAKAAGVLRPGVEVGPALALLYGPVYTPLLFGQPVPDPDTMAQILSIALQAIFNDPATG
jgi:AcrR family transcriptional regulator